MARKNARRSRATPLPKTPMPDEVAAREAARQAESKRELGRPQSSYESPPPNAPESRKRDTKPETVDREPRKKRLHRTRGPGSFA